MSQIKDVTGEAVSKKYVDLSMWMMEKNLTWIDIDYNGSNDSGEVSYHHDKKTFPDNIPENIEVILESILFEIVSIDFNNSGCNGSAKVFIEDGMLLFEADHSEIIEETKDSSYSETLIDTSLL